MVGQIYSWDWGAMTEAVKGEGKKREREGRGRDDGILLRFQRAAPETEGTRRG